MVTARVKVNRLNRGAIESKMPRFGLWAWDALECLEKLPKRVKFDLVVTSPPYNLGKSYEARRRLTQYVRWQEEVIERVAERIPETGSVCWQVGNYVDNGQIEPLDLILHPVFKQLGFSLRNRIVWRFGHGLHCQRRFSGRYEVVLWYTRSDNYQFNLDAVRIPSKYPGKRAYNGPNAGKLSGHPSGRKNPEDVWDIPNVKAGHCEKTIHPCQFPVGLAERLILALTKRNDLVFDPFAGVGSAGVAAALHGRRFLGCEIDKTYVRVASDRINAALDGKADYRPHDREIYDHRRSKLSVRPSE